MSEAPRDSEPRRAERRRRGTGGQGALQMALAGVIFVLVNMVSCQKFVQFDSARSHTFTLAPTTRQVLGAMEKRARIVVAFADPSPLRDRMWRLARTFADANPTRMRAQLLDPLRDPDTARDLGRRYSHEFKDNAVLVLMGARVEVIPEDALEIRRKKQDGSTESLGFTGEEAVTAALLRLMEPQPPTVYLVAGKGAWPATTQGNGADTLRRLLPRHHANLKELSLEGLTAIPEDAGAVLIANPRYDFSGGEIRLLREFWDRRKGGLVVLLNPSAPTPNLDTFLRFLGITPDRRTVVRTGQGPVGPVKELAVPVRFLAGPALTDAFLNTDTRFPGTSICLDVNEARDDLRSRGLHPVVLAESVPGFWAESEAGDAGIAFDPDEDRGGPLPMVAAVERAVIEDARVRVPAARMVVFANPHVLDPDALLQANVDFFLSSLNWVMDRTHLVGQGPRQPVLYQLSLTEKQMRLLHAMLLGLLPGLALVLAWVVHMRRRA